MPGGFGGPKQVELLVTGSPVNIPSAGTVTPGIPQNLISYVATGSVPNLKQLVVVCRAYGTFTVTVDGIVAGGGKTNPIETNASFFWSVGYPCTSTSVINVEYTSIQHTPNGLDVTCWLQLTTDNT